MQKDCAAGENIITIILTVKLQSKTIYLPSQEGHDACLQDGEVDEEEENWFEATSSLKWFHYIMIKYWYWHYLYLIVICVNRICICCTWVWFESTWVLSIEWIWHFLYWSLFYCYCKQHAYVVCDTVVLIVLYWLFWAVVQTAGVDFIWIKWFADISSNYFLV